MARCTSMSIGVFKTGNEAGDPHQQKNDPVNQSEVARSHTASPT